MALAVKLVGQVGKIGGGVFQRVDVVARLDDSGGIDLIDALEADAPLGLVPEQDAPARIALFILFSEFGNDRIVALLVVIGNGGKRNHQAGHDREDS